MANYTVKYVGASGTGTKKVKAASASDAQAIVESEGRANVVYEVCGPSGALKVRSYQNAGKIREGLR
jgi:hypothetical protein